jgi:hypothetical protein
LLLVVYTVTKAVLRKPTRAAVVLTLLVTAACSGPAARMQQHREKFRSLASTSAAIGEAWMSGRVSGTFAVTALEQTFRLIEQERASLASSPESLVEAEGAQLSQSAERHSRLVAQLMRDIRAGDGASVRERLAHIPLGPTPGQP